MPDLESMIGEWRRGMACCGIKSQDALDELESHLRDAMEQHMRSGVEPDAALIMAVESMGPPNLLQSEFQKIQPHRLMNAKLRSRLLEVLVVAGLVAVQIALLLPIVHKWKVHEAFAAWDLGILAVWAVSVVTGAIVFNRKRRSKA